MTHPEVSGSRTICLSWINTWQRKPSNGGGGADSQTGVTVGTVVAAVLSSQMYVFTAACVGPLPFSSVRDSVLNTIVPVSKETLGLELPSQGNCCPLGQWNTESWGCISLDSSLSVLYFFNNAGWEWCLDPKNQPLQ